MGKGMWWMCWVLAVFCFLTLVDYTGVLSRRIGYSTQTGYMHLSAHRLISLLCSSLLICLLIPTSAAASQLHIQRDMLEARDKPFLISGPIYTTTMGKQQVNAFLSSSFC